jgi:excisionase family DNA binding protein
MLTVKQAAAHLGLSPSRVLQFIRSGRLRATKLGERVWMIDIEDVREFEAVPRKDGPMKK